MQNQTQTMKQETLKSNREQGRTVHQSKLAYIAGVFDADIRMLVTIEKREAYTTGYFLDPNLKLTTTYYDSSTFDLLTEYCEKKDIKCNRFDKSRGRGEVIEIRGTENVKQFLEPIQKYIRVKSDDVELMLNEIIPSLEYDHHKTEVGLYELMETIDELSSHYTEKRKYTQQYFADEFGLSE